MAVSTTYRTLAIEILKTTLVPNSYQYYFSTYLHYYAKLVTIKIIYSNEFLKQ